MRTYREGQKRHPSSPRRALGALRTLDFFSSSPPAQQQRYIPLLQDEAQSTKYAARPTDAPLPGFLASHHQRMMTQQRHQDARSPLPLRRAKPDGIGRSSGRHTTLSFTCGHLRPAQQVLLLLQTLLLRPRTSEAQTRLGCKLIIPPATRVCSRSSERFSFSPSARRSPPSPPLPPAPTQIAAGMSRWGTSTCKGKSVWER